MSSLSGTVWLGNAIPPFKSGGKVLWAGIYGLCVLSLSGKLDTVGADKVEVQANSLLEKYLLC